MVIILSEIKKYIDYMDFEFFNDLDYNFLISWNIIFKFKLSEYNDIKLTRKLNQYIEIINKKIDNDYIFLTIKYNWTIDKDISLNNTFEYNLYILANFINFILKKKVINHKLKNDIQIHNLFCDIITYKNNIKFPAFKIFIKDETIKTYLSIKTNKYHISDFKNYRKWKEIYDIKYKKVLFNKFIDSEVLLLTIENNKSIKDNLLNISKFINSEI